jgi:hypothetical protein
MKGATRSIGNDRLRRQWMGDKRRAGKPTSARNARRLARKQARADGQMGKSSYQDQDREKRT